MEPVPVFSGGQKYSVNQSAALFSFEKRHFVVKSITKAAPIGERDGISQGRRTEIIVRKMNEIAGESSCLVKLLTNGTNQTGDGSHETA